MSEPVLTRWCIRILAWVGSDRLRAMSSDGEMLYLRLCLDQCQHGAANGDKEMWRSAHAHRCHDFDRGWDEAIARFERTADGSLVDVDVRADNVKSRAEIRAKMEAARSTNRKRKAKKGVSDAQRTLSERSTDADRTLHPPSSSSSSSENGMSTSPPVEPASTKKPSKPRTGPDTPSQEIVHHFEARYAEAHPGEQFDTVWSRDANLATQLLKTTSGDVSKIKARIDHFFSLERFAGKHNFTLFKGVWSELVPPATINGGTPSLYRNLSLNAQQGGHHGQ